MRLSLLPVALLVLGGCETRPAPRPLPNDRFYFPTGIAHVRTGEGEGTLYVASANVDRCYDSGAVRAVSLDALPQGLPPLGTPVSAAGPVQLPELGPVDGSAQRAISAFAGEMAVWQSGETVRLFVPTRDSGGPLQVLDAVGPTRAQLQCVGAPEADNCTPSAPKLGEVPPGGPLPEREGLPRLAEPFGVAVSSGGQVVVADLGLFVDSPPGTTNNRSSFLVQLPAEAPQSLSLDDYRQLTTGGSRGVATGQDFAYVVGTFTGTSGLLRLVRLGDVPQVAVANLQTQFAAAQGRGVALDSAEQRLYITTAQPDMLLVVDVRNAGGGNLPGLEVVRAVPLPPGPNQVRVIERPGRGNLVVIACTNAGSLAIYDDDLGQLATEVVGVGLLPFGLAVDERMVEVSPGVTRKQARLYVSNSGDGRVAVLDMPDVNRPENTRLVAHLGRSQNTEVGRQNVTCPVGE